MKTSLSHHDGADRADLDRPALARGAGGAVQPAAGPRRGWVAAQKHRLNRWLTAATLAAVLTLLVLGGLHWLRVWQGS